MDESKTSAFVNVKDQIGYCGIWCGSCVAGNGTLQVLTRKYKDLTETYDLKQWAPKEFDYDEFAKGLKSIADMPACPGCLQGGGNPQCEMRSCAQERSLDDCSRCAEEECSHSEALDKMRTAAEEAGLTVKKEDADPEPLIRSWMEILAENWPSSLLFIDKENAG